MLPLYEMLKASPQADLTRQIASQFGIDAKQAESAIEALMPAFSEGLRRQTAQPDGFASFMQALAQGGHAAYLQRPDQAFSPAGLAEGNAILGHLFGDKEVSRAVAKQAEATTGLSETLLKKLLPALAPLVLGGLQQQMAASQQAKAHATQNALGGGGILGQILEQMMRGAPAGGMVQRPTSPGGERARNPLEDMFEQWTGRGLPGGGSDVSGTNNPLGDIFQDMLKNGPMGGAAPNAPEPEPSRPDPEPQPDYQRSAEEPGPRRPTGGLDDLFGEMFNPSRHKMPDYEKGIESIFDQFLGPRRK